MVGRYPWRICDDSKSILVDDRENDVGGAGNWAANAIVKE